MSKNSDSIRPGTTSRIWTGLMLGVLILSIVCYLAAISLPVYRTACRGYDSADWVTGGEALFMGWLAVPYGQFAWLANLALWTAWVVLLRVSTRGPFAQSSIGLVFLAFIGLGVALSFYLNQTFVWCGSVAFGPPVIVQHGNGLYAWFASFAIMVVGGILASVRYLWLQSVD